MRILIILFFSSLIIQSNTHGQSKIISVNNVEEFLNAIKPNIKIEITKNLYFNKNLTNFIGQGYYYEIDTTYKNNNKKEQYGIIIKNVSNLSIVGKTTEKTKLICEFYDCDVLKFENCENIKFSNIYAKHNKKTTGSNGYIFSFYNSNNITINNCALIGAGYVGLGIENTKHIKCENLLISNCSEGVIDLVNTENVNFTNCEFKNNKNLILSYYGILYFFNVANLTFNNCSICNNSSKYTKYSDKGEYYLFYMKGNNKKIVFKNCIIKNNKVYHISRKKSDFELVNTSLQYQKTDMEKYYDFGSE